MTEETKTPIGNSGNGKERRGGGERREYVVDRRSGLDRRQAPKKQLDLPDLKVEKGAGIRRSEDRRSAEEGEMTDEQFEFVMAIEKFKKINNKPFPTWTDVLHVIRKLGYSKQNNE